MKKITCPACCLDRPDGRHRPSGLERHAHARSVRRSWQPVRERTDDSADAALLVDAGQ